MKEPKLRSLTKAFTWRIVGMIDLFIVSYLLTGEVPKASAITVVFTLIQIFTYYIHERLWLRTRWGFESNPARQFTVVFLLWLIMFVGLVLAML